MTPKEINEVIAEACGWKRTSRDPDYDWTSPKEWKLGYSNAVPDFFNDLNEMRKALEFLPKEKRIVFEDSLVRLVVQSDQARVGTITWRLIIASAPRLAVAFVQTINKWKD